MKRTIIILLLVLIFGSIYCIEHEYYDATIVLIIGTTIGVIKCGAIEQKRLKEEEHKKTRNQLKCNLKR